MGRCGCGSDLPCLSALPGNQASYDVNNCLYVPPAPVPSFDSSTIPSEFNLLPPASGAWVDTGMQLLLPSAGPYEVTYDAFATLHIAINAVGGGTGLVRIYCRMWNDTVGAVIPGTNALALSIGSNALGRYTNAGGSTIHTSVAAPGPTLIKAQIMREDAPSGATTVAAVGTTALLVAGTRLSYERRN